MKKKNIRVKPLCTCRKAESPSKGSVHSRHENPDKQEHDMQCSAISVERYLHESTCLSPGSCAIVYYTRVDHQNNLGNGYIVANSLIFSAWLYVFNIS